MAKIKEGLPYEARNEYNATKDMNKVLANTASKFTDKNQKKIMLDSALNKMIDSISDKPGVGRFNFICNFLNDSDFDIEIFFPDIRQKCDDWWINFFKKKGCFEISNKDYLVIRFKRFGEALKWAKRTTHDAIEAANNYAIYSKASEKEYYRARGRDAGFPVAVISLDCCDYSHCVNLHRPYSDDYSDLEDFLHFMSQTTTESFDELWDRYDDGEGLLSYFGRTFRYSNQNKQEIIDNIKDFIKYIIPDADMNTIKVDVLPNYEAYQEFNPRRDFIKKHPGSKLWYESKKNIESRLFEKIINETALNEARVGEEDNDIIHDGNELADILRKSGKFFTVEKEMDKGRVTADFRGYDHVYIDVKIRADSHKYFMKVISNCDVIDQFRGSTKSELLCDINEAFNAIRQYE